MDDNSKGGKMLQGAMIHEYAGRMLNFSWVSRLKAGCGHRVDQSRELGARFPAEKTWALAHCLGSEWLPSLLLGRWG